MNLSKEDSSLLILCRPSIYCLEFRNCFLKFIILDVLFLWNLKPSSMISGKSLTVMSLLFWLIVFFRKKVPARGLDPASQPLLMANLDPQLKIYESVKFIEKSDLSLVCRRMRIISWIQFLRPLKMFTYLLVNTAPEIWCQHLLSFMLPFTFCLMIWHKIQILHR